MPFSRMVVRTCCLAFLGLLPAGCVPTQEKLKAKRDQEVREAFDELRTAIDALPEPKRDPKKLWDLLSKSSRAAAEKQAKTLKDLFIHARDDAEKLEQLKKLGMTDGDELENLTWRGYLKSNHFYAIYDDIPSSTIVGVDVRDDRASVRYTVGTREELVSFVNEDGEWKADLKMP
jgi:hypothetical protein